MEIEKEVKVNGGEEESLGGGGMVGLWVRKGVEVVLVSVW